MLLELTLPVALLPSLLPVIARVVAGEITSTVANAGVSLAGSAASSAFPAADAALSAAAHVPVGAAEGGTADPVPVADSTDVAATAVSAAASIVAYAVAHVFDGVVVGAVAGVADFWLPVLRPLCFLLPVLHLLQLPMSLWVLPRGALQFLWKLLPAPILLPLQWAALLPALVPLWVPAALYA